MKKANFLAICAVFIAVFGERAETMSAKDKRDNAEEYARIIADAHTPDDLKDKTGRKIEASFFTQQAVPLGEINKLKRQLQEKNEEFASRLGVRPTQEPKAGTSAAQRQEQELANRRAFEAAVANAYRLNPEKLADGGERERLEAERVARERAAAAERLRLETERLEAERVARERAGAEAERLRLEAERVARERAAAAERLRLETERLEAERVARERAAAEAGRLRLEAERVARERAAAEAGRLRLETEQTRLEQFIRDEEDLDELLAALNSFDDDQVPAGNAAALRQSFADRQQELVDAELPPASGTLVPQGIAETVCTEAFEILGNELANAATLPNPFNWDGFLSAAMTTGLGNAIAVHDGFTNEQGFMQALVIKLNNVINRHRGKKIPQLTQASLAGGSSNPTAAIVDRLVKLYGLDIRKKLEEAHAIIPADAVAPAAGGSGAGAAGGSGSAAPTWLVNARAAVAKLDLTTEAGKDALVEEIAKCAIAQIGIAAKKLALVDDPATVKSDNADYLAFKEWDMANTNTAPLTEAVKRTLQEILPTGTPAPDVGTINTNNGILKKVKNRLNGNDGQDSMLLYAGVPYEWLTFGTGKRRIKEALSKDKQAILVKALKDNIKP